MGAVTKAVTVIGKAGEVAPLPQALAPVTVRLPDVAEPENAMVTELEEPVMVAPIPEYPQLYVVAFDITGIEYATADCPWQTEDGPFITPAGPGIVGEVFTATQLGAAGVPAL